MRLGIGMLVLVASLAISGVPRIESEARNQLSTDMKADFYVSPAGNDAWSGTLPAPNGNGTDGPFASFERARTAASELWQRVSRQGRAFPINVTFRGGIYFLKTVAVLSNKDSGSAKLPIIYQNYHGESPVISGGIRLQNWTNVTGNQWQTELPSSTQYFEQLFYKGQRRLRPRLGGYLGKYYRIAAPIFSPSENDPNCSPSGNRRFEQQGPGPRGPGGFGTGRRSPGPGRGRRFPSQRPRVQPSPSGFQCFDRFQYDPSDPISASWANLKPPYPEGDIELYDFERWTVPKLRIKSIDASNHIVYLTGPTERVPQVTGFFPEHRYLIENVRDLLTQPGQWFLDRSITPWKLTYLAKPGENPNADNVVAPQQPQVLIANGLQWVTFRGLTFAHDNFTVPSNGYSSPRQDTPITGVVACLNCQHVIFDSDIITQTSGGGIEFKTTSAGTSTANNAFQNGGIYDVGAFGIRVGLMPARTDTDENVPQLTTIQNNVIEGYGRVFPVGFGILQGEGHDNTYTHNEIYDGYHTGIEICALNCPPGVANSHGAFNNVISFNHIHDLSQGIMNETACIYLNTSTPNFVPSGNKVLNNKCHDVNDASTMDRDGYAGHGIYLDNFTGLVDVENNLVYRVASTALSMTYGPTSPGKANTIKNNIFAYARLRMMGVGQSYDKSGGCPSSPVLKFSATNNIFYFDRTTSSHPPFMIQAGCTYTCGFPFSDYQSWSKNIYWRTDKEFAEDERAFHVQPKPGEQICVNQPAAWQFLTFNAWQKEVGADSGSIVKNPGFRNPAYPADDYSLPTGSPISGFTVFDANQAGRSNPVISVPTVPATFPTRPYDPAGDY